MSPAAPDPRAKRVLELLEGIYEAQEEDGPDIELARLLRRFADEPEQIAVELLRAD